MTPQGHTVPGIELKLSYEPPAFCADFFTIFLNFPFIQIWYLNGIQEVSGSIPLISTNEESANHNGLRILCF